MGQRHMLHHPHQRYAAKCAGKQFDCQIHTDVQQELCLNMSNMNVAMATTLCTVATFLETPYMNTCTPETPRAPTRRPCRPHRRVCPTFVGHADTTLTHMCNLLCLHTTSLLTWTNNRFMPAMQPLQDSTAWLWCSPFNYPSLIPSRLNHNLNNSTLWESPRPMGDVQQKCAVCITALSKPFRPPKAPGNTNMAAQNSTFSC